MSEGAIGRRQYMGWTGHRRIQNEPAVKEAVQHVLDALTTGSIGAAMDQPLRWIGIGSAAVGADIIVAEACVQRGMPVQIVLPCSVDDMLAVTPTEHKSAVVRICAASEVAVPISHSVDTRIDHVAVARKIASIADVLIAVWDGSPARGPGGTAHVVKLSQERGTRIIKIDPTTGDWG